MLKENHFEVVSKFVSKGISEEKVSYVKVTDQPYHVVKEDLAACGALRDVEQLWVKHHEPNIVLLQAKNFDTSLMVAAILSKKLNSKKYLELFEEDFEFEPDEDIEIELDGDFWNDEDDSFEINLNLESTLNWDDDLFNVDNYHIEYKVEKNEIPLISESSFFERYFKTDNVLWTEDPEENSVLLDKPKNVWYKDEPTIIVQLSEMAMDKWQNVMPKVDQNLILIVDENENVQSVYEQFFFFTEVQLVSCVAFSDDYLTELVKEHAKKVSVFVENDFDFAVLHECVRKVRGKNYRMLQDTILVAKRLSSLALADDGIVTNVHLKRLMPSKTLALVAAETRTTGFQQQFVGLNDAHNTLKKIIAKMKFVRKLRENDGVQMPYHNVLMFVGNPGTAKTSFAKYMAHKLVEENLVESKKVTFASKKDLIAEYVGHTTLKVANLFKQNKGGVIFIDEAYSLYEGDRSTVFADEAMAELVLQIEENPDTIVIFAGYPEDMKKFVENANAGLKSRISHTVYFDDYTPEEMAEIYMTFLMRSKLKAQDVELQKQIIVRFFKDNPQVRIQDGNGRLMRQMFQLIFEEKAMAEQDDTFITPEHVKAGLKAFLKANHFYKEEQKAPIGFKTL